MENRTSFMNISCEMCIFRSMSGINRNDTGDMKESIHNYILYVSEDSKG